MTGNVAFDDVIAKPLGQVALGEYQITRSVLRRPWYWA